MNKEMTKKRTAKEVLEMFRAMSKESDERMDSYENWVEIAVKYHDREDFQEMVKLLYETLIITNAKA